MNLLDKFHSHNFKNDFQCNNGILDVVPYNPEVLFIGTFNHGWGWNSSDFFFGRGAYMWTILGNLFLYNSNSLFYPRTKDNLIPTLEQIFDICQKGGIVFANIVKGISTDIPIVENRKEKFILINNEYKWGSTLINSQKTGMYSDNHIENLGKTNLLDDNISSILKMVNENKSIKHIYFTFNSGSWLLKKRSELVSKLRKDIDSCPIFTPTAKGFGMLLNPPFNKRAWSLTHCWVWNGMNHHYPINKKNYGHLNHDWLRRKGVNPENF